MTENETAKQILDAAFLVHTKPVPGLLESVFGEAHLKNGIKRVINGRLDEESFSEFSL